MPDDNVAQITILWLTCYPPSCLNVLCHCNLIYISRGTYLNGQKDDNVEGCLFRGPCCFWVGLTRPRCMLGLMTWTTSPRVLKTNIGRKMFYLFLMLKCFLFYVPYVLYCTLIVLNGAGARWWPQSTNNTVHSFTENRPVCARGCDRANESDGSSAAQLLAPVRWPCLGDKCHLRINIYSSLSCASSQVL